MEMGEIAIARGVLAHLYFAMLLPSNLTPCVLLLQIIRRHRQQPSCNLYSAVTPRSACDYHCHHSLPIKSCTLDQTPAF